MADLQKIQEEALEIHEKLKGKLDIVSKIPLDSRKALSLAYTPGVAEPCRHIAKNKEDVYKYTWKGNTVAVVSDGSAVLGLGNIGPEAGLPVMEGKAAIFKEFAGLNAVPIVLAKQDIASTIATVRNIAPGFGGINLEDFKAPECFAIEAGLQDLGIPVMHDDQHGTAVVVLAGMINALRVVHKKKEDVRVVFNGAGAAGVAVMKLLLHWGVQGKHVFMCDTKGIIYDGRPDVAGNASKQELAKITNSAQQQGTLADAVKGADVFIGLSAKGALTIDMAKSMNNGAIVFAMANPDPEILPDDAKKAGIAVIATGRSDFPNQVNNSLGFPGIFRGALDCRATRITTEMKVAASHALAGLIKNPTAEEILPYALDKNVVPAVAEAVKKAWKEKH
jgi:malate dehydrogenase (oxaloacetate-decarboxylating)